MGAEGVHAAVPQFRCPRCATIVDVADPYRFLCTTCGYANYTPAAPPRWAAVPEPTPPSSYASQPPPTRVAPATPPGAQTPYASPPQFQPVPPTRSTPVASVFSLVIGIVSVCIWWIPFVGAVVSGISSIVAIVLGAVGIKRIHKEPLRVGGRGLAIAGLVLGAIGLLFTVYGFLTYTVWLEIFRERSQPPP